MWSAQLLGGSGGMPSDPPPPGNFGNFRRFEIDSGTFWDTCTSWKGTCTNKLYAVGIIVDFRMTMACLETKSLRVYATRVVRAHVKPRPSLDLIYHAHHSAGLQACGDERRDQGRSIVTSALWLVAALALFFVFFCLSEKVVRPKPDRPDRFRRPCHLK